MKYCIQSMFVWATVSLLGCSHIFAVPDNSVMKKKQKNQCLCEGLEKMQQSKKRGDEEIVVAKIRKNFVANNETFMSDGNIIAYDTTELVVVEPNELQGRLLTYYHDRVLPDNSDWKKLGSLVSMLVKKYALDKEDKTNTTELYSSNVRNAHFCRPALKITW